MNTLRIRTLLAVASVVSISVGTASGAHAAPGIGASLAHFEGSVINLSAGWSAARACDVRPTGTWCYRTEAEMDAATRALSIAMSRLLAVDSPSAPSVATACSAVKLYDGTSFTGPVVQVNAGTTNLASLGFANRTSSYRVGSCSASLRSGGAMYPGLTAAGSSSTSMIAGWDNALTTVVM